MPEVPTTRASSSRRHQDATQQGGAASPEQDEDVLRDAFGSEDLNTLLQDCEDCEKYSEELSLSLNAPKPSYTLAKEEDNERNALLRGKSFKGHVYKKLGNHYQIWALKNMLTVRFSYEDVDLDKGFNLKVELSRPGTCHQHAYATQASHDDPARRIAVRVEGTQKNGDDFLLYAKQPENGWKEPMRLNTVFDWFSGATIEQIAAKNQPRRYIYISEKDYMRSPVKHLSKYIQGGSPMAAFQKNNGRCGRVSRENA